MGICKGKHRERKSKLEGGKRIKEERAQRVEEESEIGANGETKKKYWNVGARERACWTLKRLGKVEKERERSGKKKYRGSVNKERQATTKRRREKERFCERAPEF